MTDHARASAGPRVLLVEDDAAIRQFVAMALEEHPLQLVECPTLAAARRALLAAPAALVLLDLSLPDGSGLDLLRDTALRRSAGSARWVIFSAGLSPAVTAQLATLDVERCLPKPVSLSALSACVDDALRAYDRAKTRDAQQHAVPPAPAPDGTGDTQPMAPDGSEAALAQAATVYFEGDLELFAQMRARAHAQFAKDAAAGDAALAAGDLQALRRVAHSLKTILRMLGHPQASHAARELESVLAAGSPARWPQLWTSLRSRIMAIAES